MIVVMLLAQCALLVGYFADQSWKKKLPHDDTGEAAKVNIMQYFTFCGTAHASESSSHVSEDSIAHSAVQHAVTDCTALQSFCGDKVHKSLQIEKFVEKDLSIIKWVALGAFIIQVLSVLLACWLTSVQKAELEAAERYGIIQ